MVRHNRPIAAAAAAVLLLSTAPAKALSFSDLPLIGGVFGNTKDIPINETELSSLGCLVFGASAAGAALILGGTAAVATANAGTATAVAIPVLAGAAAAGCAFGSAAAPGLAWLGRNTDKLRVKVEESLPSMPSLPQFPALPKIPPLPPLPKIP